MKNIFYLEFNKYDLKFLFPISIDISMSIMIVIYHLINKLGQPWNKSVFICNTLSVYVSCIMVEFFIKQKQRGLGKTRFV